MRHLEVRGASCVSDFRDIREIQAMDLAETFRGASRDGRMHGRRESAAKNALGFAGTTLLARPKFAERTGQDHLWMWIRSCLSPIPVVSVRWGPSRTTGLDQLTAI
jgi:hypothetical protein